MTLLWFFNRLRSMSPAEIAYRAFETAKKISARNRLEGWARYNVSGPVPVLPGLRQYVSRFDLSAREEVARAANGFLEGRFLALGRPWPQRAAENLFPAGLWVLDPVTGQAWPGPEKYCFDIPYRQERTLGDIKYVWEINRLQFLQSMALHAFLTGCTKAIAAIEAAVKSWHDANPPFRGLGWAVGIEISLRAISLLVVTSLVGEKLSRTTISSIRSVLLASMFWLARYPSLHSSANNHLVAELAGIYLTSLAMSDLPLASTLHERARTALNAEASKQFFADGVPAEQSPTYGAFSAEYFLICDLCKQLAPATRERLYYFADYVSWLADDAGHIPAIGDNDEGRVLCFTPPAPDYAIDVARRIKTPISPCGIRVFRDGGYTVVRDTRWHVVFDHGPLGYLSVAAHGHADALSVWASLDGVPLLIDPGTYLYQSGREERDWFRGTRAHNTLNIDGLNQSQITGPFNWSQRARCTLENVCEGSSWSVTASHDGYERRFGVRHRRRVGGRGDRLVIEDSLIGGTCEVELVFQFSADFKVLMYDGICRIQRHDKDIAQLEFDPTGRALIEEGHISPYFSVKISAPRVVWRGVIGERAARTAIVPV